MPNPFPNPAAAPAAGFPDEPDLDGPDLDGPIAEAGAAPGTPTAAALVRGIGRLFARNGIYCLPEMPLRCGRRADLMGIDGKGLVVIVEIKVSRADLLGDGKWTDYLDYCDRFYWGLPPQLDRAPLDGPAFLPERCGLIVADGYDAEILRPAPSLRLAPARRKVEVERLARAALRRLVLAGDPRPGLAPAAAEPAAGAR